ncbi:unnamed protein product [Urochloa humidicola]
MCRVAQGPPTSALSPTARCRREEARHRREEDEGGSVAELEQQQQLATGGQEASRELHGRPGEEEAAPKHSREICAKEGEEEGTRVRPDAGAQSARAPWPREEVDERAGAPSRHGSAHVPSPPPVPSLWTGKAPPPLLDPGRRGSIPRRRSSTVREKGRGLDSPPAGRLDPPPLASPAGLDLVRGQRPVAAKSRDLEAGRPQRKERRRGRAGRRWWVNRGRGAGGEEGDGGEGEKYREREREREGGVGRRKKRVSGG